MADNITTDKNYLYPRKRLQPESKLPKFGVRFTLAELKTLRAILFLTEAGQGIKDTKILGEARLLRKKLEKIITKAEEGVQIAKHGEPICPPRYWRRNHAKGK